MKLWQQPARPLPVKVRPMLGETLFSYTRRLSRANELKYPTTLMRALGEPAKGLHRGMVIDHGAQLNEPALERLETFTGIPRQRLRKSLPCLNTRIIDLPIDTPMTKPYRGWGIRTPCDECVRRIPGRPDIRVHPLLFPLICERHSRWIDTSPDDPRQFDLTDTPEIITAHRKYARLRAVNNDHQWSRRQLHTATHITRTWARNCYRLPSTRARWQARAGALHRHCHVGKPPQALVLPEAIILAQVLSDLDWRRHVAMSNTSSLNRFYRHIAHRLGEQNGFARYLAYSRPEREPLIGWVFRHRDEHQQIQTEYWLQRRQDDPKTHSLPENRHFK